MSLTMKSKTSPKVGAVVCPLGPKRRPALMYWQPSNGSSSQHGLWIDWLNQRIKDVEAGVKSFERSAHESNFVWGPDTSLIIKTDVDELEVVNPSEVGPYSLTDGVLPEFPLPDKVHRR